MRKHMVDIAANAAALERVAGSILRDDPTPQLRDQATQLVMGSGSPTAELVLIGEAPGKQEDLSGLPFVGASGKFLNELLASISLERSDIYITNIVKYRPPNNRDPTPAEVVAFQPYLAQQIDIICPKVIVFLGRHAMKAFLPELKIGEAHGTPVYRDSKVYLPLYHPAAALYNGRMRQTLIDDFAKIPALISQQTVA